MIESIAVGMLMFLLFCLTVLTGIMTAMLIKIVIEYFKG